LVPDANRGSVGENLAAYSTSGDVDPADFIQIVQNWYDEINDVEWSLSSHGPTSKVYSNPQQACKRYDPATSACDISHYTQLVWAASNKIGCGAAICYDDVQSSSWLVFVCRYSPRGNLVVPPGVTQAIVQPDAGMLPPFTFGLWCSACGSICGSPGLCAVGSAPLRCIDTITSSSPLTTSSNSFSSCAELIAYLPDWCSTFEILPGPDSGRCPLACGICSIPPGVGQQFCHTTTTTTTFTTTTSTTTIHVTWIGTTTTTTTEYCEWVCFDEYPTTTMKPTTATTTTITTLQLVGTNVETTISGSLVLTVPDAAALLEDEGAKNSIAAGIAEALGIPSGYVNVTITLWTGGMRRLGDAVTVNYIVTIPASAAATVKTETPQRAMVVTVAELSEAIQRSVAATKGEGYNVVVNSKTTPAISRSVVSPGTANGALPRWRYQWGAAAVLLFAFS